MAFQTIWHVGAALVALAERCSADTQRTFTAGELAAWVAPFKNIGMAKLAIDAMSRSGLAEPVVLTRQQRVAGTTVWRLTANGIAAMKEALLPPARLHPAASGPMTPPSEVEPFTGRLWSLLRIRKILTADDAASLLVDAGGDVAAARRRASALLLAWSRRCPQAIRLSDKRVAGQKRYVLLVDIGPTPPDLRAGGVRK